MSLLSPLTGAIARGARASLDNGGMGLVDTGLRAAAGAGIGGVAGSMMGGPNYDGLTPGVLAGVGGGLALSGGIGLGRLGMSIAKQIKAAYPQLSHGAVMKVAANEEERRISEAVNNMLQRGASHDRIRKHFDTFGIDAPKSIEEYAAMSSPAASPVLGGSVKMPDGRLLEVPPRQAMPPISKPTRLG
jgi:hypothetical protein